MKSSPSLSPLVMFFALFLAFSLPAASLFSGCGGPTQNENTQETTTEQAAEVTPEGGQETTPEQAAEAQPEPQPEQTAEAQPEPQPEQTAETQPEPQPEQTAETQPEAQPVSLKNDVLPIFMNNGCFGCHGGGTAGLRMNAASFHADVVGKTAASNNALNYITPNDPSKSLIFLKVGPNPPTGGRMGNFSQDEIELLELWILEGAKDN